MPKIKQIPSQNDQSFQVPNIPSRTFTQQNNQSGSRLKKSLHDSVVPIHEVSYNPQFSKSPLARIEMQRNAHILPVEPYPEESRYYDFKQNTSQGQEEDNKTNWKSILCCVLTVIGIVGLIVGLYFLVSTILGHKSSQNEDQAQQRSDVSSSSGIAPVYVEPISYNDISSPSLPASYPSTSPSKYYNTPNTYPSNLPSSTSQKSPVNSTSSQNLSPSSESKTNKIQVRSQAPDNYDSFQNSIQPIDVYKALTM